MLNERPLRVLTNLEAREEYHKFQEI
jgi:hypothetical protein